MSNFDARQSQRENLFLIAQLRVGETDETHQVKVRNLSTGGTMAEGDVKVARGELVSIELRNLGWVEGSVAWKQDNRFGIAFIEEIDPEEARAPAALDPTVDQASASGGRDPLRSGTTAAISPEGSVRNLRRP